MKLVTKSKPTKEQKQPKKAPRKKAQKMPHFAAGVRMYILANGTIKFATSTTTLRSSIIEELDKDSAEFKLGRTGEERYEEDYRNLQPVECYELRHVTNFADMVEAESRMMKIAELRAKKKALAVENARLQKEMRILGVKR